jgi:hypothetical protein
MIFPKWVLVEMISVKKNWQEQMVSMCYKHLPQTVWLSVLPVIVYKVQKVSTKRASQKALDMPC